MTRQNTNQRGRRRVIDYDALRLGLANGSIDLHVVPLRTEEIELIAWSGSSAHLENVLTQLARPRVELDYLTLRVADGAAVAKGGVDFAREEGAGTIWQLATHPTLEGLGLATRLIAQLEACSIRRGLNRSRLSVGVENERARGLYEHLGYAPIGTSTASWQAERAEGTRYVHHADLIEMAKDL